MDIEITLESLEPPEGSLRRRPNGPWPADDVRFAGWLGLLRALEALAVPAAPPPEDRQS